MESLPLRLLVVEDREVDAELMIRELRADGFAPDWRRVWSEQAYGEALDNDSFELILADYSMPQFDAMAALGMLRQRGIDVPFIVVTGSVGEERAVACMREGAADSLLKDRLARLGPAVRRALADKRARDAKREAELALQRLTERLEAENVYLQQEIKSQHNFDEILGDSLALREVLARVEDVASTDATRAGRGRDRHRQGAGGARDPRNEPRAARPFVAVNCAALSARR